MGNSCMGVHCFACQIREQTTSDKTGLEQGQIQSTRWSTMSEPNYLRHATTLLRASGASKGNMGCPVRVLLRGDTNLASSYLDDNVLLGWLE